MIEYRESGSIFDEDVQALVNPVNCVGVMGKGLALQFKQRYPAYFDDYQYFCLNNNGLSPGTIHFYLDSGKLIYSFPTKRHWRDPSNLADIKTGLYVLAEDIKQSNLESIVLPALGCGLGGLDWQQVKPLIEATFEQELPNIRAVVFLPQ